MFKVSTERSLPLYSITATRELERKAQATLPPHTLMQRAGLAAARLTLALAPHAQRIWVACGPGNNGGDGFEAALQLQQLGKAVTLTWTDHLRPDARPPEDARASMNRALAAGLNISAEAPHNFDFCIDALLGIGSPLSPGRPGSGLMIQWLDCMHASGMPVLSLDVPTGLDADTGTESLDAISLIATSARNIRAGSRFTLSFLTLKPGLFTASGRDRCGQVWFDDLGVQASAALAPCALLQGADGAAAGSRIDAAHVSHKGSFGDVAVLGGASLPEPDGASMAGAALLAARAALHAGAGRVFVALLGNASMALDPVQPELMFRSPHALDFKQQVLVCGCGGGEAVKAHLPLVLSSARRAVLDADALNAIAGDAQLQTQLVARQGRAYRTILTPHPLEAARLLGLTAAQVQANRLAAAQQLADRFKCVVVLKGSGSVIAAPGETPVLNLTGNARLATAGTGDVLAGIAGAYLAAGQDAWTAACRAVYRHGALADNWSAACGEPTLTASGLARLARP